jgi:hypothetical protein
VTSLRDKLRQITYVCTLVYEPLRAWDGLCGPDHNATCLGTGKQCCNSKTWTCGDSAYVYPYNIDINAPCSNHGLTHYLHIVRTAKPMYVTRVHATINCFGFENLIDNKLQQVEV